MRLIVVTDTHLYAPKATHDCLDALVADIEKTKKRYEADKVYLSGDIIDLKNCPKHLIRQARADAHILSEKYNYILGNHEGNLIKTNSISFLASKGFCCITHLHRLFWDAEKWQRWESKEFSGIGPIKYAAMCIADRFDEAFLRNGSGVTPEIEKKFLAMYDSYQIVIGGHKHPEKKYDLNISSKRLIILPRGITILDV